MNDMATLQAAAPRREQSGGVRHFLFAEEVPYGLAIVRMLLPLALLAAVIPRWFHARELFSVDGAPAPLWYAYGQATLFTDCRRNSGCRAVQRTGPVVVYIVGRFLHAPLVDWRNRPLCVLQYARRDQHDDQILGHCITRAVTVESFPMRGNLVGRCLAASPARGAHAGAG